MFKHIHRHKKAQSAIEFTALIIMILWAFLIFQKYIVRGFVGRWKGVGDSLGQERIYDPNKTAECRHAAFIQGQTPVWFAQDCFEQQCMPACILTGKNLGACTSCLGGCSSTLSPPVVDCTQ